MTVGSITLAGKRWKIEDVPPHVVIKIKQLFPRIGKAQEQPFFFENTLANCADLAWFMQRYPMDMAGVDRWTMDASARAFDAKRVEVERMFTSSWIQPEYLGWTDDPDAQLRPYQAQVAEMLVRSGGLLCGDDLGLGKTVSGIASCLLPGALPAAVVCQRHLQGQWVKQIERFTNLKAHAVKQPRPYLLPPADVLVFSYTQIAGWADMFRTLGLNTAIYDEAQELRTGVGTPTEPIQKGLAAARLSAQVRYRLGLTATPIYGYGVEMWNVMQFIRPDVLGQRDDFRREWCIGDSVEDPKALGTYLRDQHAFLRRTKADVGQQYPPVNRIVEPIGYDAKTVHDAETLARALAIKATSGDGAQRGMAAMELDTMMRHETGVAKALNIASFVRMLIEAETPVVLALWHRAVYAIVMKQLEDLRPLMYTGSETPKQKQDSVDAFLAEPLRPFLISLRSGAGLDGLQTVCSTMVIGELDWSPGVHDQLIGRLDREGQTEPVTAFFLVVEEGSDPPMMEVVGLKASEAKQIVDPTLGVTVAHTDGSKLQTLVNRYLEKAR